MAIELLPDLILSDVMMPVLSGVEMCSKLKRNIQTSHIPIVLLTAKGSNDYKIKGLETGADDYISKPFDSKLLVARIKNIIQNRILLQKRFREDPTIKINDLTGSLIDQEYLLKAIQIIEANLSNSEFSVQLFAETMNLGRSKFYAKIKSLTGQTPNELILSVRLKKAGEMILMKDGRNVSEIAYAVGYSDPQYFSKSFKQHFGVSPTKYGN